jgi:hypothetical protein
VVNEVASKPIRDSRVNLLEKRENDAVQPCEMTQASLDSDFGVKFYRPVLLY